MIDYLSIGRRIRQNRVRLNITQEQLAEMVNVSVPHISRIENGSSQPSLQVLVDICNILKITIDDLLEDSLATAKIKKVGRFDRLLSECSANEIELIYQVSETILQVLRNL